MAPMKTATPIATVATRIVAIIVASWSLPDSYLRWPLPGLDLSDGSCSHSRFKRKKYVRPLSTRVSWGLTQPQFSLRFLGFAVDADATGCLAGHRRRCSWTASFRRTGPSCLRPSCLGPSCLRPSCLRPSCLRPSCLGPYAPCSCHDRRNGLVCHLNRSARRQGQSTHQALRREPRRLISFLGSCQISF